MNYRLQKRLAAEVLGVGESRVWINPDPEVSDDIADAITREDIRGLIRQGLISVKPKKGNSHSGWLERREKRRKGHRRGYGKRKGVKSARLDPKEDWINRIRKMRRYLRYLRDKEVIDRRTYRRLYRLAKGGMFSNISSLRRYMRDHGILREE
ncbi:MAG: 50S ribosomal protein L19e [Desulfurococcales archaeon]|nr:50S ribosomal protein L19e [Desulfurococcales archaeon]